MINKKNAKKNIKKKTPFFLKYVTIAINAFPTLRTITGIIFSRETVSTVC
jgi:hypothetical protein